MRTGTATLMLVLTGAIGLSACSSDDEGATAQSSSTTTTAATAAGDSTELCRIFGEIGANRGGRGTQFDRAMTAEGWERRIETTAEIVAAAPAEWRDEAEVYLDLVKDRAELARENGYVSVNELPADVRDAFIAEHREEQAEANELIAYMGRECGAAGA